MESASFAILKSLVSVAWADGEFGAAEKEMMDALLVAFDASTPEADELRAYAATRRGLDDLPLDELSNDDVRVLIMHAVLLTFIDGTQDTKEAEFVRQMAARVGIPGDEASELIRMSEERARRHIALL